MKKNLTLWSLGLAILTMASCSKADLSANSRKNSSDDPSSRGGQTTVTTYAGQSIGLDATIWSYSTTTGGIVSTQTLKANTGFLPLAGGTLSATEAAVNIDGKVIVENLNASTTGQAGQTVSQASATNLNITIGTNVITATSLASTATATCGSATGSTQIQNLVVNGTPIVITGAPNQGIPLPNGALILVNSHGFTKGKTKNITVTALRVIIPNQADVKVAVARAEVKC